MELIIYDSKFGMNEYFERLSSKVIGP